MFRRKQTSRNYTYYGCSGREQKGTCDLPFVKADVLETLISDSLLCNLKDEPLMRRTVTPGEDHTTELEWVAKDLDELDNLLASGQLPPEGYTRGSNRLLAEQARLAAIPSRPASEKWEPTGQTFGQRWEGLDTAGRHAFLLDAGIRAEVGADAEAAPPLTVDQVLSGSAGCGSQRLRSRAVKSGW